MFKEMIQKTIEAAETRENAISDGKTRCPYRDLPEVFTALDDFFREFPQRPGESLGMSCGNSLPEAILLLWLLVNKRSTVIIPRGGVAFSQPEFCRYKVSVKLNVPNLEIKSPAAYLDVETNPEFREGTLQPGKEGSIFLRTSGSTAEPKLVLHDHEKFAQNALNCRERFRITNRDNVLIPVPVYHMYGLGAAILPAILAGANISLMEQTNIIRYLDRERRFQPTTAFLTPVLIEMLLQTRKTDYPYRLVVTAGDRINRDTYENFETRYGLLINLYGSTELGAIATSNPGDPLNQRAEGSVEPLPGVSVAFANRETPEKPDTEPDTVSEILCTHDFGFDTYIDKRGQAITTETARPFATKDLGKRIGENRFRVVGRIGNSINRSGILVAYSEVETLMEQGIPEVAHAVITTDREDNLRGKRLIAWCELKPGAAITPKELRSRCFDLMPRHMVPDETRVIPQLPRLPNGKFDRKALS